VQKGARTLFDLETQRLTSQVFDAAPTGFVLTGLDGRISHVNQKLLGMFGYTREEVLGKEVEFLLPKRYHGQHKQMRGDYCATPTTRSMGAGRNLFARHAEGNEFPVEIGLNALEMPEGTRILASVVDISERIRLEAAFQNIFDASPFGIVMVDDQSRIVMANPRIQEILGYRPEDLLGIALEELIPERYRRGHPQKTAAYRVRPEVRSMGGNRDLTALHKDGKEVPVEIGLSPVVWKGAQMTMAAVTDITLRKKMELDLRQANSNLEEFTHVASHDLSSPLRGIADLVDWVVEDLGDGAPDSVKNNLGRVQARVNRMEQLIRDLLSYARAGKASAEVSIVDPGQMFASILELQPMPAGFTVSTETHVPPFHAAKTPLETVLRNLLSNAVKHHDRDQGHIQVMAEEDDSYCRFTVADDGPGIPESAQERIFRIFQTLSANARGDSSGIGLAVTKRLVEAHGGCIEVHSKDGCRGSEFQFWWPRFPRKQMEGADGEHSSSR
jgi:PAS domain S-box-containing protein